VEVLPQGLSAAGSQPDDGFIQMAVSPWNPARVVLYAGGNTDAGVVKAAQAVSTGLIQPGSQPNLAIISDVSTAVQTPSELEDRTFASLGYPTRTVNGYGYSTLDYNFFIAPGQVVDEGAYLNLVYAHSALLDFDNSSLVVSLNDQRIGSERFTEETSKQTNTVKINLPPSAMRTGDNRLSIQVDLVPLDFCSQNINNSLWFTVSNASLIHLPLIPSDVGIPSALLSLGLYNIPFLSSPTLDKVGFVLDPSEPDSWNIAASLAAELGRKSGGKVLGPEVVFGAAVTDTFLQSHDLIVIGRPSQLPVVAKMAEAMPAPFDENSDQASERNMAITYRLEPSASIGYIELFNSPFDSNHTVMTVLGSTKEGLGWSGNALKLPALRSKLAGNFAVINREQILTTDTRIGLISNLSATAIPGAIPSVVSLPASAAVISRPKWILPAIIIFTLLIIGLLIFLVISARNQNASPKR
jgi:cellulose synthase operon protein B